MTLLAILMIVLVALVALAGLTAIVALVVVAIVKNRPGLAALAGGLVLAGMVGIVLVVTWTYIVAGSHAEHVSTEWFEGPMGVRVPVAGEARLAGPHDDAIRWGISLPALLLVSVGVVAFAVFVVRRLMSEKTMGEHRLGWMQALAIVVATLVMLAAVGLRWGSRSAEPVAAPQVAGDVEDRNRSRSLEELEEKFTAPKIPLTAESPPAEQSPGDEVDGERPATDEEIAEWNGRDPRDAEPVQGPPAEAAIAAEELAAGIVAFGRAMSQVFDQYAGTASANSSEPAEADAARHEAPAADPRPDWIDDPPKRVGTVWREVLVTDEYATDEEAYEAANYQLLFATYNHFRRITGQSVMPPAERLRSPASGANRYLAEYPEFVSLGVGVGYIRREIAKDEYLETVERSFGPMKKLYTLVEFTPSVDRDLRERWAAVQKKQRIATVGGSAATVVGILALLWGLLRIDTWTKGYYTGRLFLGAGSAIIGLVVLLLMRWNI